MFTIQCNMLIPFLLHQASLLSPGHLLFVIAAPEGWSETPKDYIEPWIFSKLHFFFFFNESLRLSVFESVQGDRWLIIID